MLFISSRLNSDTEIMSLVFVIIFGIISLFLWGTKCWEKESSETEQIVWQLESNELERCFCRHSISVSKYCTTAILKTALDCVPLEALHLNKDRQRKWIHSNNFYKSSCSIGGAILGEQNEWEVDKTVSILLSSSIFNLSLSQPFFFSFFLFSFFFSFNVDYLALIISYYGTYYTEDEDAFYSWEQ